MTIVVACAMVVACTFDTSGFIVISVVALYTAQFADFTNASAKVYMGTGCGALGLTISTMIRVIVDIYTSRAT